MLGGLLRRKPSSQSTAGVDSAKTVLKKRSKENNKGPDVIVKKPVLNRLPSALNVAGDTSEEEETPTVTKAEIVSEKKQSLSRLSASSSKRKLLTRLPSHFDEEVSTNEIVDAKPIQGENQDVESGSTPIAAPVTPSECESGEDARTPTERRSAETKRNLLTRLPSHFELERTESDPAIVSAQPVKVDQTFSAKVSAVPATSPRISATKNAKGENDESTRRSSSKKRESKKRLRGISARNLERICKEILECTAVPNLRLGTLASLDVYEEDSSLEGLGLTDRSFQFTEQNEQAQEQSLKVFVPDSDATLSVNAALVKEKSRNEWSVRDVADHVLPHISLKESRKSIRDMKAGAVYVVYSKSTFFAELVASICAWIRSSQDHSMDSTLVWIDSLSRKSYSPQDAFSQVQSFGNVLVHLDSLHNPQPLSRAFCVMEIIGTLTGPNASALHYLYAPCWKEEILSSLSKDRNSLLHVCDSFDSSKATCDSPALLKEIHNILSGIGSSGETDVQFDLITDKIAASLRDSIAEEITKVVEEDQSEKTIITAAILNHAGACLTALDRKEKAVDFLKQGLELERELGVKRKRIAQTLQDLSCCYRQQGQLDCALDYAVEALGVLKDKYGSCDENVSSMLVEIGSIHNDLENGEAALLCFEESLEIDMSIYGESSMKVAGLEQMIAVLLLSQDRLDDALAFALRSLEKRENRLQRSSIKVVTSLATVGEILRQQGKFAESLDRFEQALVILWEIDKLPSELLDLLFCHDDSWRQLLQKYEECDVGNCMDHQVIRICTKIGAVHQAEGSLERALVTWSFALALSKQRYGEPDHELLQSIAVIFESMGQRNGAYDLVKTLQPEPSSQ